MARTADRSAYPPVIGIPGGGLVGAHWAQNDEVASIGRRGEQRTASVLDALASERGPTVLHDLVIPIPGIAANIDHVLVSGHVVVIFDTKVWRPGFYWTLGKTRRGIERFPAADKRTLPMACDAIGSLLDRSGIRHHKIKLLMVVWPSNDRARCSLWAYRPQGATHVVTGQRIERGARTMLPSKPADQAIVTALVPLVSSIRSGKVRH